MGVSLRERYGNIKEMAGQIANNKAALAGKQSKQAAAMSNASKMTQALLASQAMNDAVSSGFDEGIDKSSNITAQVAAEEAREKDREQNQKQFEASQAQAREEAAKDREENKKNRIWNFASQLGGSMLGGLWG